MSSSDTFVLVAGLAAWAASLVCPGWVRRAGTQLWCHLAVLATTSLGALVIVVIDPLAGAAGRAATLGLRETIAAPGLSSRILGLAWVLVPVVIDSTTRGGVRALWPAALRLGRGALWWPAPLAAVALAAHGASDVWGHALGGELAPVIRWASFFLLGASAPRGTLSTVDPLFPAALYWVAGAGCLTLLAGTTLPAAPGAFGRAWRVWLVGLVVGATCGAALALMRPLAAAAAPFVWWLCVFLWAGIGWRGRATLLPGRLDRRAQSAQSDGQPSYCLGSGLPAGLLVALLTGCLLLALQLRWQHLVLDPGYSLPLSADAQSYFDEASKLGEVAHARSLNLVALFFSGATDYREPVFIYLQHLWLEMIGRQELHAVFLSLLASLVWIAASSLAIGALLGSWTGIVVALLLAIDDVWIRNAVIGLREETAGALLMLEVAALYCWPSRQSGGRGRLWWAAPLCAAFAGLTRLDALPFGLFVLAWAAVTQRWPLRHMLTAVVVLSLILGGTLGGYARARGEASPSSTIVATMNWRDEFQDRLGTPGFEPDRRVTAFEYLFVYHTPAQLAWYTIRGAARIYGTQLFDSLHYRVARWSSVLGPAGRFAGLDQPWFPSVVFLTGCAGLLARRRRRWRTSWLPPALCLVGVLPPIGFSAGVPGHMLYQARYGYMVAPFASGIIAWSGVRVVRWLAAMAARRGWVHQRRGWWPVPF